MDHQDSRILLCAPSNSASDIIAKRLLELGSAALLRLYGPSRPSIAVLDELVPFTFTVNGKYSVPKLEEILKFRVVVATCSASYMLRCVGVPRGHSSHIFVDECAQTSEPEGELSLCVRVRSEAHLEFLKLSSLSAVRRPGRQ